MIWNLSSEYGVTCFTKFGPCPINIASSNSLVDYDRFVFLLKKSGRRSITGIVCEVVNALKMIM